MILIRFQMYLAFFCPVILTKSLTNNSNKKWRRDDAVCDYLYEDCDTDDYEFHDTNDGIKEKSKKDKLLLETDAKMLDDKDKQNSSMDSLEDFNWYDHIFTDMHEHSDYETNDTINKSKEKIKKQKLLLERDTKDWDNKDKQDSEMDSLEDFNYYDLFTDMNEFSDYEFDDTSNEWKEEREKEKLLLKNGTKVLDNKNKQNSSMDSLEDFNYYDHVKTKTGDPMRFFPVASDTVHFEVQSTKNAYLWLSMEPKKISNETFCEIYLGGYDNLKCGIRRNEVDDMVVETPNILSGSEFRAFWVRWYKGVVSLGREGEKNPFLSWEDPDPFPVAYVGVESRDGASATWKIQGIYAVVTESTMVWWWDGEPKTQSLPPEIADCGDEAICRYPFSTKKTTKQLRKGFDLP